MLIAKKLKYPAYAYVQDRIGWANFYKKFFVPDVKTKLKFSKNKKLKNRIKVTGDLMIDSVSNMKKWSPHKNVITFFPGSRQWQIDHTTPIYQNILSEIKKILPAASFQVASSPFVKAKPIKGAKMVGLEDSYKSELAITIPGTNTARLASMGIPMLVVFPLDNPDVIPLEGIPHFIGMIPYFGSKFKRLLADTVNKKVNFFALPNIKAKKEIIPEIRGVINPKEVAQKTVSLIKNIDQRIKMSEELQKSMGKPGAALRIMEEINETLH